MEEERDSKSENLRSSEVLRIIKPTLLEKFDALKEQGLASDIYLFGSIIENEDSKYSDIDLLVKVQEATPGNHWKIQEHLCGWVKYPIHILLDDETNWFPKMVMEDAIKLCNWK